MSAFPTVRLVLFAKLRKDGSRSVALRVTYLRKSKFFFLNRHCFEQDWDASSCRFKKSMPGYRRENDMLATYEQRASDALREMERDKVPFSFERVERALFGGEQAGGATLVVALLRSISSEFRERDKYGTSKFYHSTANAVEQFRQSAMLSDLDEGWISKFERWIDVRRNTNAGGKSIHLRTLRAACNRAVKDKIMPAAWYPFASYSLSHLKTKKAKKSAGIGFIRALEAHTPADPEKAFARALFLFSFYCRGMNLADIAELTTDSIQAGRIVYTRKKTGRQYSIPVNEKAAEILKAYACARRLFPVYNIQVRDDQKHWRRNKVAIKVNVALRAMAADLGFDVPGLSFYTARHTYADSLKKAGVSVEVISQALGHSDVRITDNYLKGFGDDVLDAADRLLDAD